jgi:hypothetical protein
MTASKEITGNTLRIYLHLVTHGPCELREVQRGLGLSTPSLASYHLNRLIGASYVKQDRDGKYFAIKEASIEILEGYTRIGTTLVPQILFFTIFFTILITFFSYQTINSSGFTIYLVATSLAMVILLWYETIRLWRRLVVEPEKKET